jgi:hypothetical protein
MFSLGCDDLQFERQRHGHSAEVVDDPRPAGIGHVDHSEVPEIAGDVGVCAGRAPARRAAKPSPRRERNCPPGTLTVRTQRQELPAMQLPRLRAPRRGARRTSRSSAGGDPLRSCGTTVACARHPVLPAVQVPRLPAPRRCARRTPPSPARGDPWCSSGTSVARTRHPVLPAVQAPRPRAPRRCARRTPPSPARGDPWCSSGTSMVCARHPVLPAVQFPGARAPTPCARRAVPRARAPPPCARRAVPLVAYAEPPCPPRPTPGAPPFGRHRTRFRPAGRQEPSFPKRQCFRPSRRIPAPDSWKVERASRSCLTGCAEVPARMYETPFSFV